MKISEVCLLMSSLFIFSCKNDKGPLPMAAAIGECDSVVYYKEDIVPIMNAKCATPGCHVPGSSYGDFTTYTGTKVRLDDGTIKSTVFNNTPYPMPQAGSLPLTDAEKKKLNCWIKQSYPNNSKSANTSANTCTSTISYSLNIAPILSANCSSTNACHGAASANGVYTSYTGLKTDVNNGKLNNRLIVNNNVHNPPAYVPPLSQSDINKINCWIQQSSPNN
jgi:hypothetical protein